MLLSQSRFLIIISFYTDKVTFIPGLIITRLAYEEALQIKKPTFVWSYAT